MTIDACPAGKEAVALPLAIETEGVALLSRKPDGYEIVMVDKAAKLVVAANFNMTEANCLGILGKTMNDTLEIVDPI